MKKGCVAWGAIGVLVVAVFLFLSSLGGGSGSSRTSTPRNTPRPTVRTVRRVVYEVVGNNTSRASLTLHNEQGGTEQYDVSLPWSKTLMLDPRDFAYISAQNELDHGGLTVRIKVDGEVWKESECRAKYCIASCSGSVE